MTKMTKEELWTLNNLFHKFAEEHSTLCVSDKTMWDSIERVCSYINMECIHLDNPKYRPLYGVYHIEYDGINIDKGHILMPSEHNKHSLKYKDMIQFFTKLEDARRWLNHQFCVTDMDDLVPAFHVRDSQQSYYSEHIFVNFGAEKYICIGIEEFPVPEK